MVVWVDDVIGCATTKALADEFMENFKYPKSQGGHFDYCLRIKVDHYKGMVGLSQTTSIEDLAIKYRIQDSNPISTPMENRTSLTKEQMPKAGSKEQIKMAATPYRQLLGSLLHICQISRGDIAGALQILSRFGKNPAIVHWKALKRVLIYLYHTRHRRLVFGKHKYDLHDSKACEGLQPIEVYVDADHAGCKDTSRSTSGTVIKLFGDTILTKSKRQGKVSNSTAMAELHALAAAARKADHYRQILFDLSDFYQKTIPMMTDSQVVVKMLERGNLSSATKHLRIAFHEVKEKIDSGEVTVEHIPGDTNPSDVCTKPLPGDTHKKHTDSILNDGSWKNG